MQEQLSREQLLAKALALETQLHHKHREQGYQLGKDDLVDLDNLIQRALVDGGPDALRQFVAIRVAHEVHGKVSYDQLKLLKEVSHVLRNEEAFKSHRL
jgi:hypothetical protein